MGLIMPVPAIGRVSMSNAYRNYKDNVFCLLHREKANLLELYNAMNGTSYDDPRDLTVVTLPSAICIQYRNDAAYTFNSDLSLYEQQSTDNPNIPLRMLHYISEEYKKIVPNKLLYRGKAIRIPTPHFVVFFNGTKPMPEKKIYRLSELFEKPAERPELDLTVTVFNINDGNNQELLAKCKTLRGYMKFVNKVRVKKEQMTTEAAVRSAVDECIAEDILKEFFTSHKEEVIGVSIFEFDEKLYREAMLEDGIEIGIERGMEKGRQEGMQIGIERGKLIGAMEILKALGQSDEQIKKCLMEKYHLNESAVQEFWRTLQDHSIPHETQRVK